MGPGSVTPFALINDRDRRVQPLLDQAMLARDRLNFHPLTNRATTTIAAADLPRFLEACGHRPQVIDLDESGVATEQPGDDLRLITPDTAHPELDPFQDPPREENMAGFFQEFKEFAMRGNVVDLAVGLVIGAAFGTIVNSLVNDIIMPPIGLVMGNVDFSDLFINLSGQEYASLAAAREAGAPVIAYGAFINVRDQLRHRRACDLPRGQGDEPPAPQAGAGARGEPGAAAPGDAAGGDPRHPEGARLSGHQRRRASEALGLEGVAGVGVARAQALPEPAHALLGAAVGEGLGHARSPGSGAAGGRRRSRPPRSGPPRGRPARAGCGSGRRGGPRRRRSSRPAAPAAPRARSPAASPACWRAACTSSRDAEQVLHVVADLVGDDVGLGEVARGAEARAQLVEEAEVDVDLLVARTVERAHRRLGEAAGRIDRAREQHQGRLAVVLRPSGRTAAARSPRCRQAPPRRTARAGRRPAALPPAAPPDRARRSSCPASR